MGKVYISILVLAVGWTQAAPRADPQVLLGGVAHLGYGLPAVVPATHEVTYKTITPTVDTNVVATGAAVPVAVGGYKAVAGSNGDLAGAVHEVPALFGAPALNTQTNEDSQGSLTVGTSAIITHTPGEPIVNEHTINVPTYGVYGGIYGKREAEPFLAYGALPYAGHLGYGLPAVVPATHEVTYKTITPTVETNVVATNLPVPVAVGGYKAVAGDNGDLKGAVHDVPALFSAPALNTQVNEASQGSLTVGTSAVITHTAGEPIVNEHTVTVPTYGLYGGHFYGKREAEEKAAAPVVYAGYPFAAGYPYAGLGHLGYPYAVPHVVPATHEVT